MSIPYDDDLNTTGVPRLTLEGLGWDCGWAEQYVPLKERVLFPARVTCEHRETYDVAGESGELRAEISGRFRHEHSLHREWPAVGNWVAIAPRPTEGTATIHEVLPRRSCFSRKVAGDRTEEQIVAANVDIVFLVTSLDRDFNIRRIERYLTVAWASGARPIILLNKADICADVSGYVSEVEAIAFGTPVLTISAITRQGLEELHALAPPGITGAFLGSSGVGKSSLVNALVGKARQATQEVRDDDSRGHHTTTSRELLSLPGGGLLIDTPGMRELQIWADDDGLGTAFADVEALASQCKTHCRALC